MTREEIERTMLNISEMKATEKQIREMFPGLQPPTMHIMRYPIDKTKWCICTEANFILDWTGTKRAALALCREIGWKVKR